MRAALSANQAQRVHPANGRGRDEFLKSPPVCVTLMSWQADFSVRGWCGVGQPYLGLVFDLMKSAF